MKRPTLFVSVPAVLLLATCASATITGTLITGSGGTLTISLSSITFNVDPSANPPGPPWNGEVATGTSLSFAGCPSGVLGTPGCLDAAPFSPTEGILFANGTPIVLSAGLAANNPFIQFAGNGVTHVTLDFFIASAGPGSSNTNCAGLSVGETCSLFAGSPLIFTDLGTSSALTLSVSGTATDGSGMSTWSGAFSGVFANMTPEQIQTFFCPSTGSGGSCTAADFTSGLHLSTSQSGGFSASATQSPVPEPASLLLLGAGLSVLAGVTRRKLVK